MWLVRIALSRPYTFVVLALVLFILGVLSIKRTPTDILPSIDIPVISVVWTYNGLPPDEMANRITSLFERAVSTTVNNIEHIESQSLMGVNVIKLYFQPHVDVGTALAEVTAISQTLLKFLPPGVTPPLILRYDASTVPIMHLILSSNDLSEQSINDWGNNFIRTQLATVQGAALPSPYGGKVRQIDIDMDAKAMQMYHISPQNVVAAVNQQAPIVSTGTEKIGPYEYIVKLNNSPQTVEEYNNLPIRYLPNQVLYIRDVAHVRDAFSPQTNIVRMNGQRAVMMPIQKTGSASTLNIIDRVKALLPIIQANLPPDLNAFIFADQSVFVRSAIHGVITEGIVAALLTGLMILLFLGSLRSTFIITLSIPLSILSSLSLLALLGETINMMTLGGLALAVGILVDDATVAIENINWNIEQGKKITQAILDGAQQIAIPALVSTLCICIVFVPMFFLGGVAQYLFVPFAEAVVFAMLASYFLSRTLVPTMAHYLLSKPLQQVRDQGFFARCRQIHVKFEHQFVVFRAHYRELLLFCLKNARSFMYGFLGISIFSVLGLWPFLGENFFPKVDAGQIKLHVRAATGLRVEETARLVDNIDTVIRQIIPETELDSLVDNIGLPVSGINLSYSNSATIGPQDADILISLKPQHRSIETYIKKLRDQLNQVFPGVGFSFLPADIVNQILNFGLPSAINIQVIGLKEEENKRYVKVLVERLKRISGLVDVRTRQADNYPEILVDTDRSRALELGFTEQDVAANLLVSLTGNFQIAPNFWVEPHSGVSYQIVSQIPQYAMYSLQTLRNIPLMNLAENVAPQILGAVADFHFGQGPAVVSHYNVQPVIDIFADTQDRDLGAITKDISRVLTMSQADLPKGSQVILHGQIETQENAYTGLYWGLAFSIVLIYFLIFMNLQSWVDPFIIISALFAALAGIAWMLFVTHTTLSVPALTGAIMCMGVATANSILVVSFARQHQREGHDAFSSALEAGFNRLRPVLMTALAMILGMLPMALGLGKGGEQNAPLGRAVIGGLSCATIATLFFVPVIFYVIHQYKDRIGAKKSHVKHE